MREYDAIEMAEENRVRALVENLAQQKGRFVTLSLEEGKPKQGYAVEMDIGLRIVYLDVRKPHLRNLDPNDEDSKARPHPQDLQAVDLQEVTWVEVAIEDDEAGVQTNANDDENPWESE
jgi:hypothetical protein